MQTLTCDQVRAFDAAAAERYGLPGRVLMENAGASIAACLLAEQPRGPIGVLCGKGNNGGDGLVAARRWDAAGLECRVLLTAEADSLSTDSAANLTAIEAANIPCRHLANDANAEQLDEAFGWLASGAEWLVDALLGIGVTGPPRSPLDQLIKAANDANLKRLAIDVPSGLNADTGEAADPTFQADLTCTLAAAKPGLLNTAAEPYVGRLVVGELGVPRGLLREFGLVDELGLVDEAE